MVAVAPGPRAEQEDLIARIGDFLETDPPGLGEVAVFEGSARGRHSDRSSAGRRLGTLELVFFDDETRVKGVHGRFWKDAV